MDWIEMTWVINACSRKLNSRRFGHSKYGLDEDDLEDLARVIGEPTEGLSDEELRLMIDWWCLEYEYDSELL